MAQTLRLKRSSVPGRVPTTATLQTGEIAINTADGLVYIRKDDDSIIPLLGANTVVTGSITLLGSVTATSFTGSFSGSAEDLRGVVLDYSASAGDGMLAFTYNGSADALISLDTGSDHFVNAVVNLIDTNAPSIIAQDTTGPSGIDISYNSDTGALSASLLYPEIQLGLTTIQLGNSAASVTNFDLENTKSTGSFSGSFTGIATQAISASHAVNSDLAATASYAIVTTTASYAETSTSASHAINSDLAVTASYSLVTTSASYATNAGNATTASFSTQASTSVSSSYALSASYAESSTFSTFATFAGKPLIDVINTSPYKHYVTFTTGGGYNQIGIDPQVLSYTPDTNELDHKGNLIVSGNIGLTGDVVGNDVFVSDWGSVSASLASIQVGANNLTLQQVTDIGSSTTNSITAPSFTGSLSGTASYALVAEFALNVAPVDSGSFLTTGSIAGDTITLQKIDGSTFNLTVNNVANATSASYAGFASSAESASYAAFTAFAQDAISASYAATASSADDFTIRNNATVAGNLTVEGIVTAQEFHTEFVSASIVYSSGSTKFGDTIDDVHQFTGSVFISGSTVVTGSLTAPDITINDWGSVSASLAAISGSAASAYGLTLQEVTDNGNQTTNHVSISSSLNVQDSIYSKGEEVLDFAVAMAIALG